MKTVLVPENLQRTQVILVQLQGSASGQQSGNREAGEVQGQPARNVRSPREQRTAQALDRLAQAETQGGLSPDERLNMMGDVNAARGFSRSSDYPHSVARKVQVGACSGCSFEAHARTVAGQRHGHLDTTFSAKSDSSTHSYLSNLGSVWGLQLAQCC